MEELVIIFLKIEELVIALVSRQTLALEMMAVNEQPLIVIDSEI